MRIIASSEMVSWNTSRKQKETAQFVAFRSFAWLLSTVSTKSGLDHPRARRIMAQGAHGMYVQEEQDRISFAHPSLLHFSLVITTLITLSRIEGNANRSIWEITAVQAEKFGITPPQSGTGPEVKVLLSSKVVPCDP
jgi:hypothetical protein